MKGRKSGVKSAKGAGLAMGAVAILTAAVFASPGAVPAWAAKECQTPPDAQVVNNSGAGIFQVKVGGVLFQENLSACGDGCSTGFKAVPKGANRIAVKASRASAWEELGTLGAFAACAHHSVNLVRRGNVICAELYTRKKTGSVFNLDASRKKIAETCRSLPAPGGAQGITPPAGGASSSPPSAGSVNLAPGPAQMALRKPEIANVVFKQSAGDTSMMNASPNRPGGSSSESVPTIRAEYGERLRLHCGFITENVQELRVRLVYENGGHCNPPSGTPQDLPDGKKRYSFETTHTAEQDEILTLQVTGTAPGGISRVEKQLRIDSRSPALELTRPSFDDETRRMTFRVKNAGEMTFPAGPISVFYHIKGMPGEATVVRSSLHAQGVTINRDHTVPVGTITLPESALAYDRLEAAITLRAECNESDLPEIAGDYAFTWETRTFTIDETLLGAFSGLFSGLVRINTFEGGHGDRSDSQPFAENDSRLELNVTDPAGGSRPVFNQAISIPWFRFGSDGVEAYIYIDDLEARIDGRNLFFIREGKLGLRIAFDCGASREIEVWARDAIAKCWRDNWLPDLDLRNFSIELMLTPVLDHQAISYSNLAMNARVDLEIPGHRVEEWLEREAASRIENSFAPIFDNDSVRTAIENCFRQLVNDNPLLTIRRLVGVRGSGNSIIITYR